MARALESCKHDRDGFALWISARPVTCSAGSAPRPPRSWPGHLLRCLRQPGRKSGQDAVVRELSVDLGALLYLRRACADVDVSR